MKRIIKAALILVISIIVSVSLIFGENRSEKYYQKQWCDSHNGEIEVLMRDYTRCDCVTETHAVKVDFAEKWAEAIGKALHYSNQTGKRGGIALIGRGISDHNKLIRVSQLIKKFNLPIDLFIINIK